MSKRPYNTEKELAKLKPGLIEVTVCYNFDFEGDIYQVIQRLSEYPDNCKIERDYDYDDCRYSITQTRLETDDEFRKRAAKYKTHLEKENELYLKQKNDILKNQSDRRKLYEELKKEFEK